MRLKSILGVALLESRRGFRAGYAYISSILSTVWLLIFFYILGGPSFLPHVVIGSIISLILSVSGSSAIYDAYYDLIKLRDIFLASPVSPLEFRIGIALGNLLPSIPTLSAYFILLFFITNVSLACFFITTFVTILITWIMGVFIGYIVSRGDLNAGPKINLVNKLLTLLPPIYYPTSLLPKELRFLAYLVPTYNISELVKCQLNIAFSGTYHIEICTIFLVFQLILIISTGLKIGR
ncbi:MAG: hypothetical protein DRJ34_05470 [Thermoprotei archaeon]|nr:MAG: hypothetical protein DRJ34_05470 [Thermoprotei archaeon]